MTEQEAIERLKCMRLFMQIEDDKNDCKFLEDDYIANDMAVKALEKQIPMKPTIIYGKPTNTHRLGRLMQFKCPRCGKFIVGLYETDTERGGGISPKLNGCSNCQQAIDFTEWRYKGYEEELTLED